MAAPALRKVVFRVRHGRQMFEPLANQINLAVLNRHLNDQLNLGFKVLELGVWTKHMYEVKENDRRNEYFLDLQDL